MRSLKDKTILVTRAAEDADRWSKVIRSHGARVCKLPCIRCEPVDDPSVYQRLRECAANSDWLVLTSRRGAAVAADVLGRDLLDSLRVACVGKSTAEIARQHFSRVELEGPGSGARALAEEMLNGTLGAGGAKRKLKLVLPTADRGRQEFKQVMEAHGCQVEQIVVYKTVPVTATDQPFDLSAAGVNVILLASPSAVEGLLGQTVIPPGVDVVSIGPATSKAIQTAGLSLAAEAKQPNLTGLLEAIP